MNRCRCQVLCAAVTIGLQYLLLSAFFVMLVQGVALLVKLKIVLHARSRLITYCILGWGQCSIVLISPVDISVGLHILTSYSSYCMLVKNFISFDIHK